MCGLAGFIGFANNADLAQKANKIQQHRGPDNQSVWHDDYLAFAHQRLSIIDLSEAANQPFHKHNLPFSMERYIIIKNSRISLDQKNRWNLKHLPIQKWYLKCSGIMDMTA